MLIKDYLFALIKKQKLLFFSMALLSALTFSLFVGSSYALDNYKISIEDFFSGCNYPSAVVSTEATPASSFDCLDSVEGVNDYDVRFSSVFNLQINSEYYHVQLNTYKEDDFSTFAPMSDSFESRNLGIAVDQQFADKHDLELGDIVFVGKDGNFCTCTISQIVLKPENLNYRVLGDIATDNIGYGVIYLSHDDLDRFLDSIQLSNFGLDSNQVLIDIDPAYDKNEVLDNCCDALSEKVPVAASYIDEDSPSIILRNELTDQFTALSETVPLVQLAIVCLIFVLFLIQIIKKHSKEIGVFLSFGYQKTSIYALFAAFSFAISIVSIVIGLVLAVFIGDVTYGLYKRNVYLPVWTEYLFFDKILLSSLVIIAIGQIACFISAFTFIKSSPMDALQKNYHSSFKLGKDLEVTLYGVPTAIRLAFNTIVQNLRNFIVIVLGFIASFVMIYSAFSIYFALQEYVNYTYDYQNNYDAQVVSLKGGDDSLFDELRESDNVSDLIMSNLAMVDIAHDGKTRTIAVRDFPDDCELLRFRDAFTGESISIPETGILVDEITAEDLGVRAGDYVEICDKELEVVAISAMYSEQFGVVSISQMEQLDTAKSKCAFVNITDDDELRELCAFSSAELCPIFTSDFKKMEVDFKAALSLLIDIIVFVSVLLGFIVVCTVSTMTLEKTKRTISILRAQGMRILDISNYWALQMVLQLLLAFLIGLPLAGFAGRKFVQLLCSDISYYPYIADFGIYVLSFAFIIAFSLASHLVITYLISRFNLAQNVQSRE